MINILIACNNLAYATTLMNHISDKNENIRVCAVTKINKEIIKILNSKINIDIILLDLRKSIYSGEEILNRIIDKKRYYKSFFIISDEISYIKQLKDNILVYDIFFDTTNLENIILCHINKLINEKNNMVQKKILKNNIIEQLLNLGYDMSYKGTQYLIDVILYIILNPTNYTNNLEKDIYPVISQKYNITCKNVKSNIIRANNSMYYDCEVEKLKNYFNFSQDKKPKIKTVIETVIYHIKSTKINN